MRITAYRKLFSLTQQDFAKQLGVSQGWVSRVELRSMLPSAKMAVHMETVTANHIPRWEYRHDLWKRPQKEKQA